LVSWRFGEAPVISSVEDRSRPATPGADLHWPGRLNFAVAQFAAQHQFPLDGKLKGFSHLAGE
jgi:hypothetical protein